MNSGTPENHMSAPSLPEMGQREITEVNNEDDYFEVSESKFW